jgi:23S rRNA (adenine2030-N6)-methyltransferase
LQEAEPDLYPGSPYLAQQLTREQDKLTFCELHPDDSRLLERNFSNDFRCKSLEINGFKALKAQLPPKERRGLVLIDPPFELTTEFEDIVAALTIAHRKWATGIYAIWYPIKGTRKASDFTKALSASRIPKTLRLELFIDNPEDPAILSGCGLIVINPPWTLKAEAEIILPFLAELLGRNKKGSWQAEWLSPE